MCSTVVKWPWRGPRPRSDTTGGCCSISRPELPTGVPRTGTDWLTPLTSTLRSSTLPEGSDPDHATERRAMELERPLPHPITPEAKPYWDGLREHKLML